MEGPETVTELLSGPDFVCIGAQKAGTTWLYDNLLHQEGIWMPPEKEIHFFNTVCPNKELIGVETRPVPTVSALITDLRKKPSLKTLKWLKNFHYRQKSTRWYYSLFSDNRDSETLAGDITPAYSTLDERGVHFARQVLRPGCRILLLLRNPIDRFWSSLKMNFRGMEAEIPLDDTLALLKKEAEPSHRLRGDYPRIVRTWRDTFDSDFQLFRYDDLVQDPAGFLGRIGAFIGKDLRPDSLQLNKRSNYDPRRIEMPSELRELLFERFTPEIRALEEMSPGSTQGWLEV